MIPANYTIRADGTILGPSGKQLKPWLGSNGYLTISIYRGGRIRQVFVHALVCEFHHGPRPTVTHQVRHLDGDKLNNAATNLAWGTPKQNHEDMDRHGRRVDNRGERAGQAKLTWERVAEIRERYAAGGISVRALAQAYGVSGRAIHKVLTGATWRSVAASRGLDACLPAQVGTAHNALDDARWTREAWQYLTAAAPTTDETGA